MTASVQHSSQNRVLDELTAAVRHIEEAIHDTTQAVEAASQAYAALTVAYALARTVEARQEQEPEGSVRVLAEALESSVRKFNERLGELQAESTALWYLMRERAGMTSLERSELEDADGRAVQVQGRLAPVPASNGCCESSVA